MTGAPPYTASGRKGRERKKKGRVRGRGGGKYTTLHCIRKKGREGLYEGWKEGRKSGSVEGRKGGRAEGHKSIRA
jgi:hypothetical protein